MTTDTTTPPKKYRLKKLRVREASLVGRGANQGARKLLWKDDEGATPEKTEALAALTAATEVAKAAGASLDDVDHIMDKLYPDNDAGAGSPDNPAKGDGGNTMTVKKEDPKAGEKQGEGGKVEKPEVPAPVTKEDVKKMSTCPKCGHEFEPGEEMKKHLELPAEVRKELDEAKAATAKLTKELADQKRAALVKEVSAFAGGLTLPGMEPAKVEAQLLKLHDAGQADVAKELEGFITAVSAIAKDSVKVLSKEGGYNGGTEKANSAVAQMNKLAKEKAEKEKISFHKAYDAVFEANPTLAAQVLKEERATQDG